MNALQNFNTLILLLVCNLVFSHTNPKHKHTTLKPECDLCACTTSGGNGLGDLATSNFIGLRYMFQNFESKNGIFNNSPKSEERFHTYQIWGRIPISDKFNVSAIIPYQDLYRELNNTTEHINGIGDISVIGWYKLKLYKKQKNKNNEKVDFNATKETSAHSFNFGLGIKLPTGDFENALTDRVNPGFQVGTGSVDYITSIIYNYNKEKFGINTTVSYYLKSENKNEYRFGNQFSYATTAYYNVALKDNFIRPYLGVTGDVFDNIKQYNQTLHDTNGNILNGSIGSELALKKMVLGVNYNFPLSQNLFADNVEAKHRFSLYLNYSL